MIKIFNLNTKTTLNNFKSTIEDILLLTNKKNKNLVKTLECMLGEIEIAKRKIDNKNSLSKEDYIEILEMMNIFFILKASVLIYP